MEPVETAVVGAEGEIAVDLVQRAAAAIGQEVVDPPLLRGSASDDDEPPGLVASAS
jgi:hypothetical protein